MGGDDPYSDEHTPIYPKGLGLINGASERTHQGLPPQATMVCSSDEEGDEQQERNGPANLVAHAYHIDTKKDQAGAGGGSGANDDTREGVAVHNTVPLDDQQQLRRRRRPASASPSPSLLNEADPVDDDDPVVACRTITVSKGTIVAMLR